MAARLLSLLLLLALAACAPLQAATADATAATPTPAPLPEGFLRADGPRAFSFPADFGPHEDYLTEWWYYTGNLDTADGRHFGYELTFFRIGLLPAGQAPPRQSGWASSQIYMAHFAVSDVGGGEFHAFQRYSSGAAGLAGAQAEPYRVWLEDWAVEQTGPGGYRLLANQDGVSIALELQDAKGPVLHGIGGYSQKGPEAGNASYYYTQPRLLTQGVIQLGEQRFEVSGLSWKDHEFSTNVLSEGQIGWGWFSIQLDNDYELMVYELRREDGSPDPFSSGTLIHPDGSTTHLAAGDFEIEALGSWLSPHSGASYPMGWRLHVPAASLELEVLPYMEDQEMNVSTIYWEGAVRISGSQAGQPVRGAGYVELTGYAEPFDGDF
ncbi:MAG: hypothetical protein KIS85_07780 [Anaerolineales bacterium]|nr:hypothetical protein [Anaerolineales bacterium]